ncbi:hypothetical protein EDB83DRAFT_2317901, partial [Lactarius deliciosus]
GIDFLVVEARDELGGRMRSATFGAPNRQLTVELGANWIHGTQEEDHPANPIFKLALKHNLKTVESDAHASITTYDANGAVDYLDLVHRAMDAYTQFTIAAGARLAENLVDLTARAGYALIGQKPKTLHEIASEYFVFDFTDGQSPEQSSFLASAWGSNFTYNVDQGGFSEEDLLSIDERGFKYLIQAEAAEFLKPSQNDDVQFHPPLPEWKVEAIHSMIMFPHKFWFDTEGDSSKRIEAMTDAQVQSEVMQVLRAMFPSVAVPEPTAFLFPRWFSDPLYRGSYSTWGSSFVPQHLIQLGCPSWKPLVCRRSNKREVLRVLHGAYFEGEATASQVARCIKGHRCNPFPPVMYARNAFPTTCDSVTSFEASRDGAHHYSIMSTASATPYEFALRVNP